MSINSDGSEAEDLGEHPNVGLIGIIIVAALAGLTAGLPINLPSHQSFSDSTAVSSGDTAWMMISTIMGMFIPPALGYFYGSAYDVGTGRLIQLIILVCSVITVAWVLFSYSLCYGTDLGRFIGDPGSFYMFANTYGSPVGNYVGAPTIPSSIFAMYELTFALSTAAIVACSVIDRVNTFGFAFFMLVWHVAVYCPLAHMMWTQRGWFHDNFIEDFAGGLLVHMLGALTSFSIHFYLGSDKTPVHFAVHDGTQLLRAAFLLWFLWFGASAGKAHSAGPVAAQAIVNTIAGTVSAVLIGFFHSLIMERNITPISVAMSIVIGLVAVSPASGYVTVGGAMVIAIFSYLVTITVANQYFLEGRQVNGPLSIQSIHGVGGVCGFLATAILSYKFINPAAFNGATWGNGWPVLYHFILICLFYVCVGAVNLVLLAICDRIVPLRGKLEKDAEYPDFTIVTELDESAIGAGTEGLAGVGADGKSNALRGASGSKGSMRIGSMALKGMSAARLNTMRSMASTNLAAANSKRNLDSSASTGVGTFGGNTKSFRAMSQGTLGSGSPTSRAAAAQSGQNSAINNALGGGTYDPTNSGSGSIGGDTSRTPKSNKSLNMVLY